MLKKYYKLKKYIFTYPKYIFTYPKYPKNNEFLFSI